MTASPNENQFHEHMEELSRRGIEFPRQGMQMIGGRMYPAAETRHWVSNYERDQDIWHSHTVTAIPAEGTPRTSFHRFEADIGPGDERLVFSPSHRGLETLGGGQIDRMIHVPDSLNYSEWGPTRSRDTVFAPTEDMFHSKMQEAIAESAEWAKRGELWRTNPSSDDDQSLDMREHRLGLKEHHARGSSQYGADYDPNSRTLSNWERDDFSR